MVCEVVRSPRPSDKPEKEKVMAKKAKKASKKSPKKPMEK